MSTPSRQSLVFKTTPQQKEQKFLEEIAEMTESRSRIGTIQDESGVPESKC